MYKNKKVSTASTRRANRRVKRIYGFELIEPRLMLSAGPTFDHLLGPVDAMGVSPAASKTTLTPATSTPTTLRIATYNIEDDIDGYSTPRPGLYQVLEGIGEENLQGTVQPLDVLGLEETTSNSVTVAPIVSALNTYYNGAAVYAQSTVQGGQDGSNADGNGPNAVVYNTLTLNLLASVGVGTPEGSGNGEYRQVMRYEFQPVGLTGSTGIFYVYDSHMKSGSTSADATDRGEEATIIRTDETTLPANASVLYTGDLNSNPPEAEFTEFEAAQAYTGAPVQGEAYDPLGFPTGVQYYSDSATDLRYRDDYELVTQNVNTGTGALNYVSGTLHAFGNNGTTPSGGSVDSGSDTALNTDLVQDGGTFISASTLYADLTTGSDHLPVVADYTVPQPNGNPVIGGFAAAPSSVVSGSPTTLTASNVTDAGSTITGVNFYLESNSITGLQIGSDTLVGAGTQNGTSWSISASTTGLAAGTYTFYAVATDALGVSSAVSSTTLTVTAPTGNPVIGGFAAAAFSGVFGTPTTLTASNVTDSGSTITGVNFYRETNGTSGLQIGSDTLVGAGTQNGTSWSVSAPTTGFVAGWYTYYAVATDALGVSSAVSSTTSLVPLLGDANLDGTVNIDDLTIVLANYDKTGMTWAQGDFNNSGTVDISDLSNVLANYGQSVGAVNGPNKSAGSRASDASAAKSSSRATPYAAPIAGRPSPVLPQVSAAANPKMLLPLVAAAYDRALQAGSFDPLLGDSAWLDGSAGLGNGYNDSTRVS